MIICANIINVIKPDMFLDWDGLLKDAFEIAREAITGLTGLEVYSMFGHRGGTNIYIGNDDNVISINFGLKNWIDLRGGESDSALDEIQLFLKNSMNIKRTLELVRKFEKTIVPQATGILVDFMQNFVLMSRGSVPIAGWILHGSNFSESKHTEFQKISGLINSGLILPENVVISMDRMKIIESEDSGHARLERLVLISEVERYTTSLSPSIFFKRTGSTLLAYELPQKNLPHAGILRL